MKKNDTTDYFINGILIEKDGQKFANSRNKSDRECFISEMYNGINWIESLLLDENCLIRKWNYT